MNPVIEELERRVEESQTTLNLWKAALKAAREAGEGVVVSEREIPTNENPKKVTHKTTILSLVRKMLKKHGPLSAKDLLPLLEQKGKTTKLNTLTVSLNRYKPAQFNRNSEGKWYLVTQDSNDSEKSGVNSG